MIRSCLGKVRRLTFPGLKPWASRRDSTIVVRHEVPGIIRKIVPSPLATGLWRFECERLAVARTIHSIQNQVEHHRTRTFPQEDLAFLKRPDHSTHSTRCRLLRAGALSLAHAGARFRRQISVGPTTTSTVPPDGASLHRYQALRARLCSLDI